MKKIAILLASLSAVAAAVPATAAPLSPAPAFQGGVWQNINARQARIEAKINQGIRSGALTRSEAANLRSQFRAIAALEARYRQSRPGLTMAERADLDRRFDALERSIRIQKSDRDTRGHGRHR
ncbi:hypothetical protein [Sphingomonas sp.]|uniref:hypothetical protein n=1 Tax=Sphingomonas sp. TaxID=28214 RepID=UPI001B1ACB60|nr:hypothetical protein [Sphingomonas sp.]MBO9714474.1 hypothetical protein [Sphingomonas sp.]